MKGHLFFFTRICFLVILAPLALAEIEIITDTLKDGSKGPDLVLLPAGEFKMGCLDKKICYSDEKPRHDVSIPAGIAVMTKEVTFDQYDHYAKSMDVEFPDDYGWGRSSRPVIHVSWDDANDYAMWLSEQTGKKYVLMSESVWEYAARAGTATNYFSGADPSSLCKVANVADISLAKQKQSKPQVNCDDGYGKQTAPVGSFIANDFGLYDMHGNVREWVADCYEDDYRQSPKDHSARLECSEEDYVIRGGAWYSFAWMLTSSSRQYDAPYKSSYSIGFRLMRLP